MVQRASRSPISPRRSRRRRSESWSSRSLSSRSRSVSAERRRRRESRSPTSSRQQHRGSGHDALRFTESATVMVRGLSPATTEYSLEAAVAQFWPKATRIVADRSTLERRGAFAFVEFPSVEYSRALLEAYPGSSRGEAGPKLIVDGAELSLEYGRERPSHVEPAARPPYRGGVSSGHADWLCEQCGAVNFARRVKCFACALDRPPRPRMAMERVDQTLLEEHADLEGRYDCEEPTPCLVVYGLSRYTGEAELSNAMREYAPLKDVKLLRDAAGRTRGVGFVTFFNVEAATHTLQTASGRAYVDGEPVKFAYTKGAALAQVIATAALQQQHQQQQQQQQQQRTAPQQTASHTRPPVPAGAQARVVPPSYAAGSDRGGFARLDRRDDRRDDRREDRRDHRRERRRRSPSSGEESDGRNPMRRKVAKADWPPPFEANTAAYVFDPASRYFYEPHSGFYYDPKTKVYYNAHTKHYFHYTPHTEPPFTRFDHTAVQAQAPVPALDDSKSQPEARPDRRKRKKKDEEKKDDAPARLPAKTGPIVFGLGKATATVSATASMSVPAKRVAPAFAASHVIALGSDYDQLHRLVVDNKPVVRQCPKSGKWMCLLSRRQFNTEEQLKKHVAKSQLYKESLEKAANESRLVLRQLA